MHDCPSGQVAVSQHTFSSLHTSGGTHWALLPQEPPPLDCVGVRVGVATLVGVAVRAGPQRGGFPVQLPLSQSLSFAHSSPWPFSGAHTPTEPEMSQRCPSGHTSVLQHTPSTQKPDMHWDPSPQTAPVGCGVGVRVGVSVRVGVRVGVG